MNAISWWHRNSSENMSALQCYLHLTEWSINLRLLLGKSATVFSSCGLSSPHTVIKLISVTSFLGLKYWRDKLILYNKHYSFYHHHGFNSRAAAAAAIFAEATVCVRHLSRCTGSWASLSRLPLCIYSQHCTQRDATVWRIWWATYPQPWGGWNPFPNERAIGNPLSCEYFYLFCCFLFGLNNTQASLTGCVKQHAINPVSDVT